MIDLSNNGQIYNPDTNRLVSRYTSTGKKVIKTLTINCMKLNNKDNNICKCIIESLINNCDVRIHMSNRIEQVTTLSKKISDINKFYNIINIL